MLRLHWNGGLTEFLIKKEVGQNGGALSYSRRAAPRRD